MLFVTITVVRKKRRIYGASSLISKAIVRLRFCDLSMAVMCWNPGGFGHVSPIVTRMNMFFEASLNAGL